MEIFSCRLQRLAERSTITRSRSVQYGMSTTVHKFVTALFLSIVVVNSAAAEDPAPLTDEEVAATLDSATAGVFYAWSPHMPLSVDGLHEILAVGERLDITVTPVLSSHANVTYARDRIDGRGLPESVLRQGHSPRLIEHDLFVHAPAILIYADGKFVSPVIPGFRYADDYEELISRFVTAARPESR